MDLSEERENFFAGLRARDLALSHSGQAVLEYILVLVVVVSIALGIVYQFNDSFKNFLNGYFGDYLACLIETGELPSLGGDGGVTQGECEARFANFSVTEGRRLVEGGSGEYQAGDPTAGGRAGRPASYSSSGGSFNGESNNFLNRPPVQALSPAGRSGPEGRNLSDATSADSGSIIIRRNRRRRQQNIIDDEMITINPEEKKKKVTKFKKPTSKKEEERLRSAKRKLTQTTFEDPKPLPKDKETRFSLGALLKLLVILAILVAILVFLSGQAIQIKKSWQKSE